MEKVCELCNNLKECSYSVPLEKYICKNCYKKKIWKPKLVECKRCGRQLPNHAKGYCDGCYNSVFYLEATKLSNAKRYHHIDPLLYKKIVSSCVICGFDKIVDLHHLNHDKTDNSEANLVGLCPNHHKMLHTRKYQKEVFNILREKGYPVPESWYKSDDFYKHPKS